jgi:serine/threonine protein phosphatase 1
MITDPSVFAVLPEARHNWAVASIFGEAGRLAALHAQLLQRIQPEDNLIYLGNFLGRGAVAATVHELLVFRRTLMARQLAATHGEIVYLRGSQEEMWHKLLQMQFAPNPREVLEWMLSQGVGPTLEAYAGTIADARTAAKLGAVAMSRWTNHLRAVMREADGHERLMNVLRRAAYTSDGTVLFVNAGIDPRRPLSQQSDSFWWGSRDFEALSEPYNGFNRIVRGADPRRRGVVITDRIASIDGGCGFGGPLVAACFDGAGNLVAMIES